MILCDDLPVCPTAAQVIWQIEHSVDDAAKPDRPKPVSRSKPRTTPAATLPKGWAAGLWNRFPASVEISARCIAKHESWNAGLWKAINPNTRISTASGAFQIIDGTWKALTDRAKVGQQYARAYLAPPAVQAEVFAFQAMNFGLYPWEGTKCPGT